MLKKLYFARIVPILFGWEGRGGGQASILFRHVQQLSQRLFGVRACRSPKVFIFVFKISDTGSSTMPTL
jgi:hypothetical protein